MSRSGGSKGWDEQGATELLIAMMTALAGQAGGSGPLGYGRLVREAATEPARSFVLVDMFVRLSLDMATERAREAGQPLEEYIRELALEIARHQENEPPEEGDDA